MATCKRTLEISLFGSLSKPVQIMFLDGVWGSWAEGQLVGELMPSGIIVWGVVGVSESMRRTLQTAPSQPGPDRDRMVQMQ